MSHNINTPEFSYILLIIILEFAILFVLSISSLNVYSIILSGGSSGTKYAYLGGLRSASQMISYEVAIGLIILPVVFQTKSLKIVDFVLMQKYGLQLIGMNLILFIILVISMLAETNRAPFDLPEAEAELVAGYNVEYSSTAFALFFLGEYSNMLVASTLIILLMIGSSLNVLFFALKVIIVASFFVLVRATFPRYRYNQLMQIGGQIFLPVTLGFFIFITGILLIPEELALITVVKDGGVAVKDDLITLRDTLESVWGPRNRGQYFVIKLYQSYDALKTFAGLNGKASVIQKSQTRGNRQQMNMRECETFLHNQREKMIYDRFRQNFFQDNEGYRNNSPFAELDNHPGCERYDVRPTYNFFRYLRIITSPRPGHDNFAPIYGGRRIFYTRSNYTPTVPTTWHNTGRFRD